MIEFNLPYQVILRNIYISKMMYKIIKIFLVLFLSLIMYSCNSEEDYISPIRKNINPKTLVAELRKDSIFYAFKGYGVTPRDERFNIYLIDRAKDFGVYHWVKFNPNGTKYLKFYNSYLNKDCIEIQLTKEDSLEILNKAQELISILKKCELRWAGWEFGRFNCSFNDSTRMIYIKNKNELDSRFYRFHKNLHWIDSNFVIYE